MIKMIQFQPDLLTTEIVYLKSVTTALGGSISVSASDVNSTKEVLTRIPVPLAVARSFIQLHKKITKYLKPTLTAIVRYDGLVIALERHPLSSLGVLETDSVFGKKVWEPACVGNIELFIKPLVARGDRDWFFDGRYIYAFSSNDMTNVLYTADYLTKGGKYRKVAATSIDIQELADRTKLTPSERSCLAFVTKDKNFAVSPPIWKDLSDVGASQLKKAGVVSDDDYDEDDEGSGDVTGSKTKFSFDDIDSHLSVNLNFALKAGGEVGTLFGYDAIQPLQLPRLMVELKTVNLPNIPNTVKSTYDIGISFTHSLAWLLGMTQKAETLETLLVVRSLMKYLTQRGVFRNNVFQAARVFHINKTVDDVKLAEGTIDLTVDARWDLITQAHQNARAKQVGSLHSIGSLATEI